MIIRYRQINKILRLLSCYIIAKHKADVYNASDEEIVELKKWLKFQGMRYTSNSQAYYSAYDQKSAEAYKPKITINLRTDEDLMGMKIKWS